MSRGICWKCDAGMPGRLHAADDPFPPNLCLACGEDIGCEAAWACTTHEFLYHSRCCEPGSPVTRRTFARPAASDASLANGGKRG